MRFLTVGWAARQFGAAFPYGTMGVNVLGSLAMGFVAAAIAARAPDPRLGLLVMTGILGGFTTFSAFSLDAIMLYEQGRALAAATYVCLSVILSIFALVAGMALSRSILQ